MSKANKPKPNLKARRKRLLVLADWLEHNVKPALNGAKFNMRVWAARTYASSGEYQEAIYDIDETPSNIRAAKECGFAGCAVGWGLTCPKLRPHLHRVAHNNSSYLFHSNALADVFGISIEQAEHAFMPCSYKTMFPAISTVAKRLRRIAAKQP